MDEFNVLYTVNSSYIDIMLASFYSLIINSGYRKIKIHIVADDFTQADYEKIENKLKGFPEVEFYFYNLADFPIEKFHLPDYKGGQIGNARYFFASILGEKLDKIDNLFYLDNDTLVVYNLLGLRYFSTNPLNAVLEPSVRKHNQELGLIDYYNQGVLYFNVREWERLGLEDKIIHFQEQHKLSSGKDIFNCALQENITRLPLNYNMAPLCFLFGSIGTFLFFNNPRITGNFSLIREAEKRPIILHSYGLKGIKPWSDNNVNPFNKEFMEYIKMVNPHFQRQELSNSQELYDKFPFLLELELMARSIVANSLDSKQLVKKRN